MEFSIQKLINDSVSKREDREKKRWYATDLGKCLSGAYYARLGVEKDEIDVRTLRVFKAGQLFEDWVIDTVKDSPDSKDFEFERPETIYVEKYDLACRPDLIVKSKATNQKWVYEFKSCHSDKFWWMEKKGEGPDKHYLMQTWTELFVTGIENGRLMYVSKDDLCIAEYSVSLQDTALASDVMRELNILNEAWKKQIPPTPEPAIKDGKINWKAKYCPYHHLCLGNRDWLKVAENELKALKPKKSGWKQVKKN